MSCVKVLEATEKQRGRNVGLIPAMRRSIWEQARLPFAFTVASMGDVCMVSCALPLAKSCLDTRDRTPSTSCPFANVCHQLNKSQCHQCQIHPACDANCSINVLRNVPPSNSGQMIPYILHKDKGSWQTKLLQVAHAPLISNSKISLARLWSSLLDIHLLPAWY